MSALPEFSVAPRMNWGRGRGKAQDPETGSSRDGPAFGAVEDVGRGECCSQSPRCILISAAEAAPRRSQSSTQRVTRPAPLAALRARPPPISAKRRGGAGGRSGTDTQAGTERPSKSKLRQTEWDHKAESGTAPWRVKETEKQSEQRRWRGGDGETREETGPEAGERKEREQKD